MKLNHRPVHAGRQPKVVGVNDQAAHRLSLSTHIPTNFKSAPTGMILKGGNPLAATRGRLAQLVRAPALQAGSPGFESLTAHHASDLLKLVFSQPSRIMRKAQSMAVVEQYGPS